MDNEQYLDSIGVEGEARERCLTAMEKWGGNHWWLPDVDPREFAYYQLLEPIMLTNDFSHFHQSVELLLGRPVYTHEFGICAEQLKQEAERAWTYQVGCTSDAERQERVVESIQKLEQYARDNNKKMLSVHIPASEEEDRGDLERKVDQLIADLRGMYEDTGTDRQA